MQNAPREAQETRRRREMALANADNPKIAGFRREFCKRLHAIMKAELFISYSTR
jgi:hypothetical protein